MDNRHKIAKHNTKFHANEVPYKLNINKYGDLLHSEFVGTLNGYKHALKNSVYSSMNHTRGITFIPPANVEFPTEVDWRKNGAVTPVKDQGHCGR